MSSTPVRSIEIGYHWLIQAGRGVQSPLLLVVRLCWGLQFFQTGLGKLEHIDRVTEFFTSLHIVFPAMNAYVVGFTEMIGGALLTIGLAGRLAAMPLAFTLVIAYLTSEQPALKKLVHLDIDPFLTADPFLFLFACLIILVFGPGIFSVDHVIERVRRTAAQKAEESLSSEPISAKKRA